MFGLVLVCLRRAPFEKERGLGMRWILGGETSKSDSWVVLIVRLFGVVFVISMVNKHVLLLLILQLQTTDYKVEQVLIV